MVYQKDVDSWRAERLQKLTGPDGWTTLVGLYWLKQGVNKFGGGADNELLLDTPGFPKDVGRFDFDGKAVTFTAAKGAAVTSDGKPVTSLELLTDADPDPKAPTTLNIGTTSFYAIKRVDRFGVRVKDTNADARVSFKGLEYFPLDQTWRFEAKFKAYTPMKKIPIINILGMEEDMNSPGALVFDVGSTEYRLDTVLEDGETDYFVMFGDTTNGKLSYGAGRFLYVKPPVDGVTVLDFNKSYNPPCAFSHYATCPLPPQQNKLPLAIQAGELRYAGAGH
ncbi:MAG TPA: DUF1684 domain-containing protein [Gammaproteobacteria bacterium]